MPQFDNRPFVPQTNQFILNAIRKEGTTDYRSRIPLADQANIKDTIGRITSDKAVRNEFVSALVQRIGLVVFQHNSWANPMSKFKSGLLTYGESVEEINVGLIKAKTYSAQREYLEGDIFGTNVPDVQTSFHHRNRQDYYPLTVNEQELTKAFLDEFGLSTFVTGLMQAPSTSDNWDEYLLMVRLFREYYDADGFFKVQVPDISSLTDADPTDSKYFIKAVRAMTDTLPFISTHYNAAGMPVAATADELELFVTPNANANIDVDALAAAFNIDRSQVGTRQTVIRPEDMGIPGAQAILTTRDFFKVYDTYMDTTSIQNPVGRTQNYFLHHDQIISASRFVPAILFTTEPGTPIVISDPEINTITDITITDRNGDAVTTLPRGDFYNVGVTYTTTPTGEEAPVILTLGAHASEYTTINQKGSLLVGVDETAATLTITAVDAEDGTPTYSETFTLTGDAVRLWPNPDVIDEAAPTVTSALPAGADEDDEVTITGTEFDDVTSVTFGGVEAKSFDVVGGESISAVVPAGTAGSAPIVVTNPKGASAAFAYTRG